MHRGCAVCCGGVPSVAAGDVDGRVLPDPSFRAAQAANVLAVLQARQGRAGLARLEMTFVALLGFGRRGTAAPAIRLSRVSRVEMVWRRRILQTPFAGMTSPCHRSRSASAAIRRGPRPGAKATTRSSTQGGILRLAPLARSERIDLPLLHPGASSGSTSSGGPRNRGTPGLRPLARRARTALRAFGRSRHHWT